MGKTVAKKQVKVSQPHVITAKTRYKQLLIVKPTRFGYNHQIRSSLLYKRQIYDTSTLKLSAT